MSAHWGSRAAGALLLAGLGWLIADAVPDWRGSSIPFIALGVGAIVGAAVAPLLTVPAMHRVRSMPASTLVAGAVGLLIGLAAAALLAVPISNIAGNIGIWLPVALSLVLGLGGMLAAAGRDWPAFGGGRAARGSRRDEQVLVDTSVIIDGRITDVVRAGFVHGTLLVPRFVLDELRHIADSADSTRRVRGRRGLDVLDRLRHDSECPVQVLDVDIRDVLEVDAKLVKLAQNLKVPILTTDFNLNRVAQIQDVEVLNINELAQALKPVALPGEEFEIRVVQEGKESGQGVGYLDDGTMVVVEQGNKLIGREVLVTVSRMLQTGSGRIIFAQPQRDERGHNGPAS